MSDIEVDSPKIKLGRPLVGCICPRCGERGSRIVSRWVLNDRKQRFEPYYYVGHSSRNENGETVNWCYIKKKLAEELLSDPEKLKDYNM